MRVSLSALAVGLFFSVTALAQPTYTDTGELVLPNGYERWVFIGSNLGLGYMSEATAMTDRENERAGDGMFHNIYMETAAYESFMESGEFPDPTQFMMELYTAGDRDPGGVLNAGVYNAELVLAEAAVKDRRRPIREDSKEPWAYYAFDRQADGTLAESAAAFPDIACYACHIQHAGFDNVWVQFYPRLKDRLSQ